jgi:hypothetical protein
MPNGQGFEIEILRERSSSVPFDHVRLYNPTSLDLLLRRHGFVDISIATPGRLDVEMVQREYEKGGIDLRARPELEFMLEAADNSIRTRFQGFLAATLRSSHMRCVARR